MDNISPVMKQYYGSAQKSVAKRDTYVNYKLNSFISPQLDCHSKHTEEEMPNIKKYTS